MAQTRVQLKLCTRQNPMCPCLTCIKYLAVVLLSLQNVCSKSFFDGAATKRSLLRRKETGIDQGVTQPSYVPVWLLNITSR
jgi:hypothetical protein